MGDVHTQWQTSINEVFRQAANPIGQIVEDKYLSGWKTHPAMLNVKDHLVYNDLVIGPTSPDDTLRNRTFKMVNAGRLRGTQEE